MKLRCLLLALLAVAPLARSESAPEQRPQCVVLLHGLGRTELSMKAVEWKLQGAGYTVANVTYPSLVHPIPELAQRAVDEGLTRCREGGFAQFDFVTHSLGGILLRQYLSGSRIEGLRRVVMLGPPNQGSQLADYIHSLTFLHPIEPPPVAQLGTGDASLPRQLGGVDFELGVIAGNINRRPPLPGIPEAVSDGTVAIEETKVAGMVDFIEVRSSHSFMMWNAEVLAQVLHFLENGRFDHGAAAPVAGS